MSETEDFLAAVLPRQVEAGSAMHAGDPDGWSRLWSRTDPVTLFGAWVSKTGTDEVTPFIEWLATQFADCSAHRIELLAAGASGHLAYTVADEHTTASVQGRPAAPYTLRVTHVYRREDGAWHIIHRHGDPVPETLRQAPDHSGAAGTAAGRT